MKSQTSNKKPKQSAQSYCVWQLSRKEWSYQALLKKLLEKGYTEEEATTALEKMKDCNFQNDERYARLKTEYTQHKASNRLLRQVLSKQKISEEIIEECLTNSKPEIDRAISLIRQYQETTVDSKGMQRIWRKLASKGFSSSIIQKAVKELQIKVDYEARDND